jgi:hypothetical protein
MDLVFLIKLVVLFLKKLCAPPYNHIALSN